MATTTRARSSRETTSLPGIRPTIPSKSRFSWWARRRTCQFSSDSSDCRRGKQKEGKGGGIVGGGCPVPPTKRGEPGPSCRGPGATFLELPSATLVDSALALGERGRRCLRRRHLWGGGSLALGRQEALSTARASESRRSRQAPHQLLPGRRQTIRASSRPRDCRTPPPPRWADPARVCWTRASAPTSEVLSRLLAKTPRWPSWGRSGVCAALLGVGGGLDSACKSTGTLCPCFFPTLGKVPLRRGLRSDKAQLSA